MRLKLIACKSMSRELSYLMALSHNKVDATWLRQGFHDNSALLQKTLQAEIDAVESGQDIHTNTVADFEREHRDGTPDDIDAILIGYGLCSNGVVNLHSSRYPLIIPRAHDCITMFLGSKERYSQYFKTMPGCFWYTASWIENSAMPCEETKKYEYEYFKRQGYDEDDIDFLVETLHGWTDQYKNAAYIRMPFYDRKELQDFTKEAARFFSWNYTLIDGDMSLFEAFISGNWDESRFLTVPPGYKVIAANDEKIIDCVKL